MILFSLTEIIGRIKVIFITLYNCCFIFKINFTQATIISFRVAVACGERRCSMKFHRFREIAFFFSTVGC